MKRGLSIFYLLILLLYGCRSFTPNSTEQSDDVEEIIKRTKKFPIDIPGGFPDTERKKVITVGREAFGTFYHQFCTDTVFQYSRIKFPIPIKGYVGVEPHTSRPFTYSTDTILWEKRNWEFYPTLQRFKERLDSFDMEFSSWEEYADSVDDTYVWAIRYVRNTGRSNNAYFQLYDKKYYLVHYEKVYL